MFAENGLHHISKFPNQRYHHKIREDRSKVNLQKQLYATVLKFPKNLECRRPSVYEAR